MKIAEIWTAYEQSPTNRKDTAQRRKNDVKKIWLQFADSCGNDDASTLTANKIANWLDARCANCSPKTYDDYLRIIRQVLKAVLSQTGLTFNVATEVPVKKHKSISRQPYTQEEIEKIIHAVNSGIESKCQYKVPTKNGMEIRIVRRPYKIPYANEVKLSILLGAYCGMRLADAVSVEASQYSDGFLSYSPQKTLTTSGAVVEVPVIHDVLRNALERCNGSLTPHLAEWHKRNPSELCRLYKRIFESCGFDTQLECSGRRNASTGGFHSLRHSYVTWSAEAGIPIDVVSSCVGHTSTLTTRIYNHVSNLRKAKEMARLMKVAE